MLFASLTVLGELAVADLALGVDLHDPRLAALLWVSVAMAIVSLPLALTLRPKSNDVIELFHDHVELPLYRGSRRRRRIRYCDVHSIQRLQSIPRRILMIGRRRSLAASVPLSWLSSPAETQLEEGIRAGVGALPDGAERLRDIDQSASVWAAAGRGVPWVTWAFTTIVTLAFGFELAMDATIEKSKLLTMGALSPTLVSQGGIDRLLTSAFLHSGSGHLIVNLSALVLLGLMFERLLGWPRFVLVLTLGQVSGALLWLAFPNADGAVGASAALYGLLGSWIVLDLRAREELPVFFRLPVWWWLLTAAFAVVAEVALSSSATSAHTGGFAGGVLAAAIIVRRPLDRLGLHAPRWLFALATLSILAWLTALGLGVQRAWGLLDAEASETHHVLESP
jgi:membrane associated rhomboid family serine protease